MRLILVDRGKEFCDVLRWQFRSHPEVQVVCGKFEELAYEHHLKPPKFLNPSVAQERHEKVYYGGRWGFSNPRKPVI